MIFKIFSERSAFELEREIENWMSQFMRTSKFEIDYKPVHLYDCEIEYTALVRMVG